MIDPRDFERLRKTVKWQEGRPHNTALPQPLGPRALDAGGLGVAFFHCESGIGAGIQGGGVLQTGFPFTDKLDKDGQQITKPLVNWHTFDILAGAYVCGVLFDSKYYVVDINNCALTSLGGN